MERIDHHFRADLAQKYGVDVSVFLHNIYFWVRYNRSNEKNLYEGRYWTYNTLEAFCTVHPYWSRRQIERIIAKCKDEGLLLIDCFNPDNRDRTKWYTLSDKALRFFCDEIPENQTSEVPQNLADCISPNGEMQITEQGNTFHQTVTALPDNKPNNKPDISAIAPKEDKGRRSKSMPKYKPEWFERFWMKYPPRQGRKDHRMEAAKEWDRIKPDLELCRIMSQALEPENWPRQWYDEGGKYIPLASTWLHNSRWEVEFSQPTAPVEPTAPRAWHTEIIDGEEMLVYDD